MRWASYLGLLVWAVLSVLLIHLLNSNGADLVSLVVYVGVAAIVTVGEWVIHRLISQSDEFKRRNDI